MVIIVLLTSTMKLLAWLYSDTSCVLIDLGSVELLVSDAEWNSDMLTKWSCESFKTNLKERV